MLFHMLEAVAEFETEIRAELQGEVIAKGTKFGEKSKLTPEQLTAMRKKCANGILIRELMTEYGLSKSFVYRLL